MQGRFPRAAQQSRPPDTPDTVHDTITDGKAVISNLSEDEAKNLCALLNYKMLPCKVNKGFQ